MTVNTSTEAAAFYMARDQRTVEYGADVDRLGRPVTITVANACASTVEAQMAVLALVDLLARVHRNLRVVVPVVPVVGHRRGANLRTAATATASAIDPFQQWDRAPEDGELVIQVEGTETESSTADPVDLALRWHGGRGEVVVGGHAPAACSPVTEDAKVAAGANEDDAVQPDGMLGAATAACLGAAALFRLVHDASPRPAALNLLTRAEGIEASSQTLSGPVDVGDVHVVGGGAVGHALTYWLGWLGAEGSWNVIDNDDATLHNTNRCLGMTAADAGWPAGRQSGPVAKKAGTAARNMNGGGVTTDAWYHEVVDQLPRPDLTLVLANEHGVRASASQRGAELLLHATTGTDWTSELHRHIADVDDCPACRMPAVSGRQLVCSVGRADPTDSSSSDAALPFLSALAGLALAASLLDLAGPAQILRGKRNHWRFALDLPPGDVVQSAAHRNRCVHTLTAPIRRAIHASHPTRWDQLPERLH